MDHKENCYKIAECIYHHVCITRKVVIKLRNVYIITCASEGKLVEGCGMYISSSVHHIKVVIKLRNVYIITCASQGRLVEGCGMYKTSRVHHIKVVIKMRNVYIITCASEGKLL